MRVLDTASARRTARRLIAVLLALLVAACSAGRPEPGPDLSPTPSTEPRAPDLYYSALRSDFCEQAKLHEVPAEFDLMVPSLEFLGGYDQREGTLVAPPSWVAICRFEASEALDGSSWFSTRGQVTAVVYGDPRGVTADDTGQPLDAASGHAMEMAEMLRHLERESIAGPPTVKPVPGWWDQGTYLEAEEASHWQTRTSWTVVYFIYHHNLLMKVRVYSDFWEDEQERGVELAHRLARALADEAVSHVSRTS